MHVLCTSAQGQCAHSTAWCRGNTTVLLADTGTGVLASLAQKSLCWCTVSLLHSRQHHSDRALCCKKLVLVSTVGGITDDTRGLGRPPPCACTIPPRDLRVIRAALKSSSCLSSCCCAPFL